jgi:hypothetical protein
MEIIFMAPYDTDAHFRPFLVCCITLYIYQILKYYRDTR